MTSAAIIVLLFFCAFLIAACWWIDGKLPTAEQEEKRARQDVEDMLNRANEEVEKRPHVRAGKSI